MATPKFNTHIKKNVIMIHEKHPVYPLNGSPLMDKLAGYLKKNRVCTILLKKRNITTK